MEEKVAMFIFKTYAETPIDIAGGKK